MSVEQESNNINMRLVILPLRVIAGLTALVFVLAFCYEVFILYNPRTQQKWVISTVMLILSIWALIEVQYVFNNIHSQIIKKLRYLLWIEFGLIGLYPLIKVLSLEYISKYQLPLNTFDIGERSIILMAYSALFIAIIDHIIRIFSLNEKNKIQVLETQKEKLTISLIKANKTVTSGALSASIAHELNQPLGATNLNIQFLKRALEQELLNLEDIKEVLDSLEKDNKRASTIVASLKSIFNQKELDTKIIQLNTLISKVLEIAKPELTANDIQIQLRLDESLFIKANQSELEQVIFNLLNNSIQAFEKFKISERRISIKAKASDHKIVLSIADNGPGVSSEFQSHLFELLSTTKQEGMGLGLWLCKYIIMRYEGNIFYEEAQGGGAKFVIELPSTIKST